MYGTHGIHVYVGLYDTSRHNITPSQAETSRQVPRRIHRYEVVVET